jgi:hypothetical protein
MPIHFQIHDGLIKGAFHAKVTTEDIQRLQVTLREIEARLEVTPDRIADLMESDVSDLSTEALVMFAESRRAAVFKNKVKSAIIVPKASVQYGLARMFMAHNANPDIEIRIFYDYASAYDWLGREIKPLTNPIPKA